MIISLKVILLICSVISFALHAFGVAARVNFDGLGKAFFVASFLA